MNTLNTLLTVLAYMITITFTVGVVLDYYYSQLMDVAENITLDETMGEWCADCINDMRELETNTTHDECHGPEVYDDEAEYIAQYPDAADMSRFDDDVPF